MSYWATGKSGNKKHFNPLRTSLYKYKKIVGHLARLASFWFCAKAFMALLGQLIYEGIE
jgi:hypothetical protein